MRNNEYEPKNSADAHKLKMQARLKRLVVNDTINRNPGVSMMDLMLADDMDKVADAFLTLPEPPERIIGGELATAPGLVETLKKADYTNLEASKQRLDLAVKCGTFDLALDAAESINAKNSLEQMLVHQLAVAHKLAMDLAAKSLNQKYLNEITRLASMSARMMDTFQRGMLALHKTRRNGDQTVTVQHVQVSDGGQAIINGHLRTNSQAHRDGSRK